MKCLLLSFKCISAFPFRNMLSITTRVFIIKSTVPNDCLNRRGRDAFISHILESTAIFVSSFVLLYGERSIFLFAIFSWFMLWKGGRNPYGP